MLLALFGITGRHYGLIESAEIALLVFAGAMVFWAVTAELVRP